MPDPWINMLYRDLRLIFQIHVFPRPWTQISWLTQILNLSNLKRSSLPMSISIFTEIKLSKLISIVINYPNGSPLEWFNQLNSGTNYINAWGLVNITILNISVWNIILRYIMDISIDVYEQLRRNIMQMNFWNIKMISATHGTPQIFSNKNKSKII